MPNNLYTRCRFRAFSLVELLVVIGVIALLIGILVPTLSSVRDRARATVCATNLKSIGTGVSLHQADHQDNLPQMQVDEMGVRTTVGDSAGSTIGSLFGGKIGLIPAFGLNRYGAQSRPINRYVGVQGAPPDPANSGDVSPEDVRDLSERFQIDVFNSPVDRGFGVPFEQLGLDPADSEAAKSAYEAFGSSYILNDHALSDDAGSDAPIERPTLIPCHGGRPPKITTPDRTWVAATYSIYNYDAGRDLGLRWFDRNSVEANVLFADQHVEIRLPVPSPAQLTLLRPFEGGPEWSPGQSSPAPVSATNETVNYSFLPQPDWFTETESEPCPP